MDVLRGGFLCSGLLFCIWRLPACPGFTKYDCIVATDDPVWKHDRNWSDGLGDNGYGNSAFHGEAIGRGTIDSRNRVFSDRRSPFVLHAVDIALWLGDLSNG